MLATHSLEGVSQSFLNRMSILGIVFVSMSSTLSACSEAHTVDSCIYLDAFERETSLEEFTIAKAQDDASKLISQGRIVFLGGYLETGPITQVMRGTGKFPDRELDQITEKFNISKIEKVYLTKKLNEIKSGDFLKSDDGVVAGIQVERGCYNSSVRTYAYEFNKIMISNLLMKRDYGDGQLR